MTFTSEALIEIYCQALTKLRNASESEKIAYNTGPERYLVPVSGGWVRVRFVDPPHEVNLLLEFIAD